MKTTEYYNAKPSKIGNIGLDVAGAKRMNFDTYETVEEREVKERKKKQDKLIGAIKLELKAEVLSESPSVEKIIELLTKQFELSYGVLPVIEVVRAHIDDIRLNAQGKPCSSLINKVVNSYNKFNRDTRRLKSSPSYYLRKMAEKYQPKGSFTEQSGQSFDWKSFKLTSDLKDSVEYLSLSSSAVQFGNTVTDNERACISSELSEFLKQWAKNPSLNKIDLTPVCWSFGARGKAGSVAFYQACGKIISVNRNRIGSIVHEVGHYIDHVNKHISSEISYKTVNDYRDSIKEGMDRKSLSYYCKREEIFARAFEAYCFKHLFGFSSFAQVGKAYLPELNEELISLIEKALNLTNKEA